MRVLVGFAAELAAQPQQIDHGLRAARGEAVEQVDEDRVVRSGHDGPVEDDVRVDGSLDVRSLGVALACGLPHRAHHKTSMWGTCAWWCGLRFDAVGSP